jgi:hypothetical protein
VSTFVAVRTRLLCFFALLAAGAPALSQEARGVFTDRQDGKLDASEWLIDRKGFLPVPIVITEPAVGYGAGIGLMFVRGSIRERAEQSRESGHLVPPDIFGVVLAATENGTKFGAAGGMFSFDQDRWRYRGGVARMDLNVDFFGVGGRLSTGERKVGMHLEGWASSQQILMHLDQSGNFLALRWIYLDTSASFDQGRPQPALPPLSLATRSSGAGLSFEHDSRDNLFTPSRGWIAGLDTLFYGPEIGSETRFQTYRAHVFAYAPLAKEKLVLGGRLDGRAARGDVPFYQLPFIELRGIPAMRYQDENTGVAEAELRWNFTPRWSLIGFYGLGRTWGTSDRFGDAATVVAKGAGARYLIARQLGLFMGADVAWGPEETAFYLQVGSAWR